MRTYYRFIMKILVKPLMLYCLLAVYIGGLEWIFYEDFKYTLLKTSNIGWQYLLFKWLWTRLDIVYLCKHMKPNNG